MTTTPQEDLPTNGLAIVSLITGIAGLVGVMPVIGSIAAVVSGRLARREMAASPGEWRGHELARAGEVLGWLGIVLTILGGCLFLVIVLFIGPQLGSF